MVNDFFGDLFVKLWFNIYLNNMVKKYYLFFLRKSVFLNIIFY